MAAIVMALIERRRMRARLATSEREREEAAAQLDRRISELFSLRELSFVLSESLELDHIVEQVARYARRFLQADGAIVVLGESGKPGLEVVAAEGSLGEYLGMRSDGGATLVRTAIERGRIEVVQDGADRGVALFGGVRAGSAAVVPLRIRGEHIGAIAVTDRVDGPFTTEDLWLLSTVATNASVAIGNSRLFEIVERGRREWETAFNALREGIAVVGPDGMVQRANAALAQLAGVAEAELLGRDFRSTIFGAVETAEALIHSARTGHYPAPTAIRVSDRSLRLTVAPLAGTVGAVVALVEDVTEQRALEAQLFQNEKMAAIGQLVSGVAHELNNPLTSIAGLAELLLEREPGTEPPRQHLKVIHEQADRAGRIVRNLLTFVRKGTSDQLPFDLNDVVPRTTMLIAYEMRVREIELVTQLHTEPLMVVGDHNELQQVLLNLLTNAVQAVSELPAGRRRAVMVETRSDGDRALLAVRDTGPGVPPDFVPNLFTPFFTTKAEGKGTGLGLSLSYGLVQAHGGSLSYAPVGSGGAEFTINLPLAERAAAAEAETASRRILVADDDAATHRVMAALFAPDGFVVDGARAGAQALQLAERNDYDLLIADAALMTPSGMPLVAALSADARWRDRMLTIGGRQDARRVSKPFDLRQVRAMAERLLRADRGRRADGQTG